MVFNAAIRKDAGLNSFTYQEFPIYDDNRPFSTIPETFTWTNLSLVIVKGQAAPYPCRDQLALWREPGARPSDRSHRAGAHQAGLGDAGPAGAGLGACGLGVPRQEPGHTGGTRGNDTFHDLAMVGVVLDQ